MDVTQLMKLNGVKLDILFLLWAVFPAYGIIGIISAHIWNSAWNKEGNNIAFAY